MMGIAGVLGADALIRRLATSQKETEVRTVAEIHAVVNVILFEDGKVEVICDTALDDQVCLQILQHATAITAEQVQSQQLQPQPKPKSESSSRDGVIDFTKRKR